jgi:hypothetical protein
MSDTSDTSDTFTETTSTSWLARIGRALLGVIFGIVLVIGSSIGLFWNEGRAIQTARSLTEGAGLVVDIDPGRVYPGNEGKLVHVSGDLKTSDKLSDPEFAIAATAARLVRTVEMYQWTETSTTETRKNLGGSEEQVTTYSYAQGWSDKRVDSTKFKHADGHGNPEMRYRNFEVTAADAALGSFRPGAPVLHRLAADTDFRIDPSLLTSVRGKVGGTATIVDGKVYMGADPAQPRIGDLRVGYRIASVGPISIIGKQTGANFTEFQTKAGNKLLMAQSGAATAGDMFKSAERENQILTWIIRGGAIIVMFIGWLLLMRPLVVVADVVPLIGDVLGVGAGLVAMLATAVVAPAVVAFAWLWYRPMVSVAVVTVAVGLIFLIKRLAASRSAARMAPPALGGGR